jgi:hypothetical protein
MEQNRKDCDRGAVYKKKLSIVIMNAIQYLWYYTIMYKCTVEWILMQ